MDPAVGLVQSYLRMNGFFTVTEFPVVARSHGAGETLTDIDILAIRFPQAGRWIPGTGAMLPPDPMIDADDNQMLMIIGEVKEGKSRFNRSVRDKRVIGTVIRRFGCCSNNPDETARTVVEHGFSDTIVGMGMPCHIQWTVFGGTSPHGDLPYHVIPLRHVVRFLTNAIQEHRDVFLNSQSKDEALGLLTLLAKVGLQLK